MKTKFLVAVLFGFLVISAVIVSASMLIPANDNGKENGKAEISPAIGDNWVIENNGLIRVDFIHYVGPPANARNGGGEKCYKLMGVKWKSLPVNYVINPINSGLDESFVVSEISTSAETWDTATASELFNNVYTINYTATYGVQNYQNTIDFGDYPNDSVIAVTSVWYTPVGRQIVEFDIRFNTRFFWGDASVNSALMDLQNIAVHELGHSVGLSDIYSTTCSDVTMYGYSTEGETKKRSLETPDITGLQRMYG